MSRNLLLCSDSELARRAHEALAPFVSRLVSKASCCRGHAGRGGVGVSRAGGRRGEDVAPALTQLRGEGHTTWSWLGQAREDFLDCMAVLISSHRLRLEEMLGSAIFSCVAQVAAG